MKQINKLLTKINFTDSNRKPSQIKYIVKHYCGAEGSAENNCRYFASGYRGASAHYFVGYNGEIWQSVEDNDVAWHCGAKAYKHPECRNTNSIGVEFCVKKDKNGKWYYTKETMEAGLELIKYLADKYGIDEDHILRHYDVTGKICGEPDVRNKGKAWKEFKAELKKLGPVKVFDTSSNDVDKTLQAKEFTIKTTCDVLRIRTGASLDCRVVGEIAEKEGKKNIYTIVETRHGWGKLKSGAGWISLAFTKRVE